MLHHGFMVLTHCTYIQKTFRFIVLHCADITSSSVHNPVTFFPNFIFLFLKPKKVYPIIVITPYTEMKETQFICLIK